MTQDTKDGCIAGIIFGAFMLGVLTLAVLWMKAVEIEYQKERAAIIREARQGI